MNGINYILMTYSLTSCTPVEAMTRLRAMKLSLGTCNHFLKAIVDDAEIVLPSSSEHALNIISEFITTHAKTGKVLYSVNEYDNISSKTIPKIIPNLVPQAQPVVIIPPINTPVVIKPASVIIENKSSGSNLAKAKMMYQNSVDKSRDTFVALLVKELGIPQGTATTYYYLAKKG